MKKMKQITTMTTISQFLVCFEMYTSDNNIS